VIEAELKARVRDPALVRALLEERASGRDEVYRDAYYDGPGRELTAGDRELRVRTIEGKGGSRTVLTYKGARVDEGSGSKPEYETEVGDAEAVEKVLRGLGYVPVIRFEKRCRNYDFIARGRRMLATLVRVPEIEGDFIEVETMAEEAEVPGALADVRSVLSELGIAEADLTAELYTDAVAAGRAR
jgi:adenylate cyclase class 2